MDWAHYAIADLQSGKTAHLTPKGGSMSGRVESGDNVVVEPPRELTEGDIVLVRVKGRTYLHLITATKMEGSNRKFLIGNNRGGENGWVSEGAIYGVATHVAGNCVKTFKTKAPRNG